MNLNVFFYLGFISLSLSLDGGRTIKVELMKRIGQYTWNLFHIKILHCYIC